MPPVCPNCGMYEYLTKLDLANVLWDKGIKAVACTNCGWDGEADDLDQKDD